MSRCPPLWRKAITVQPVSSNTGLLELPPSVGAQ